MSTTILARVKPDPKGRITVGKVLAALERKHIAATGFDIIEEDDGSFRLRPTIEVPAQVVITLSHRDAQTLAHVDDESVAPNAALRAAAERFRRDADTRQIIVDQA
jgi:hypothetical protein